MCYRCKRAYDDREAWVSDPTTFTQLTNLSMLIGHLFLVLEVSLAQLQDLTQLNINSKKFLCPYIYVWIIFIQTSLVQQHISTILYSNIQEQSVTNSDGPPLGAF